MAETAQLDRERSKTFMMQTMQRLNGSAVVQMMSLGNRTGLFDAMANMAAASSEEIAAAAGLQERYVREWLGAMVTGGVVDYDPAAKTYVLPPEHAAWLTTAAGPRNLSTLAKSLFSMSPVEPKIAECFRDGGGVPYSEYPELHTVLREMTGAVQDASLLDVVVPLVDGLPARFEAGIEVADVACGAGHAINLMARAYPASSFVGFDFSEEALGMARAEAESMGLTNVTFEALDVAELEGEGLYDFITTFDAVHDMAKPADTLAAIVRALKDDGTWLCVDLAGSSHLENNLDNPMASFFYTSSTMHCMTVSLAYDGEGLGSMWGEEKAREMFSDAGFTTVDVRKVPGDSVNNYYVCTKQ